MIPAYVIFCSFSNNNVEWNILKISFIEKKSSLTLSQAIIMLATDLKP